LRQRAGAYCEVVGVFSLETILLPEDIASESSVHCLACRRKLGSLSYVRRPRPDGSTERVVSVSLVADGIRDYAQGPEHVELVCDCGQRSTFHVLS
jgi:hypothetical protein